MFIIPFSLTQKTEISAIVHIIMAVTVMEKQAKMEVIFLRNQTENLLPTRQRFQTELHPGLEAIPASASPHAFYLLPLLTLCLNAGRVIDGSVVFTDRQIGPLVLVQLNH